MSNFGTAFQCDLNPIYSSRKSRNAMEYQYTYASTTFGSITLKVMISNCIIVARKTFLTKSFNPFEIAIQCLQTVQKWFLTWQTDFSACQ